MSDPVIERDDTSSAAAPAAVSTEGTETSRTATWRSRIATCRNYRRTLIRDWRTNIDYRRGKQFDADSDLDRIAVTDDWSRTKAKHAQLFSQVPEVRLTTDIPELKQSIPVFARKLNITMRDAEVGTAMDEAMPDCINAAGFGAILVSYDRRAQLVEIPKVPPLVAQQMQAEGLEVPTEEVEKVSDYRFNAERISPADLLWPVSFTHSDFNRSPWIGRSGRIQWSEAKHAFKLTDEQYAQVAKTDDRNSLETLTHSQEENRYKDIDMVAFDEIFYKRYLYHADETKYTAIQRMVFVHGIDEPVIDEEWNGQKRVTKQDGTEVIVGSTKYPIQVGTLTYLSDEAIPPSDSAVGRPQVNERIRSRSQMVQQRENSRSMRWGDVNRLDPQVMDTIQRGTWQGIIPVNGDGNRVLGEVARANYPTEDLAFERITKDDLNESWQIAPNQLGANENASESATAAGIAQSNFQTRIGYERARATKLFCNVAEVMAGFLVIFGEWTDAEKQALGAWDVTALPACYTYTVRADSSVLLDSDQRINRLTRFLNMTAKSGFVNVKPVIEELAALNGLDPNVVVIDPPPPQQDEANISLRGQAVDLTNPMVVAMLIKTGQAPTPDQIAQAKQLIASATPPRPVLSTDPAIAAQQLEHAQRAGLEVPPDAMPPAPPEPAVVPDNPNPGYVMPERIDKRNEAS